jgi:hypothetical protein
MLGRLQSAFEDQQRFIANASHELRTPLAVMGATVDVVLGDPCSTPGDLRAMAAEDVLDAAGLGDRRVHARLETAVISGDPVLAEHLIANLVDNAVRYNHAAGDIWVSTRAMAGSSRLIVTNTGPVISPANAGRIFQPFQRLSDRTSHDGFGLGLAIVASIAAIHSGTATARPRDDGGLSVTVTIPEALLNDRSSRTRPSRIPSSSRSKWTAGSNVSGWPPRVIAAANRGYLPVASSSGSISNCLAWCCRSLPIARTAVPLGQAAATTLYGLGSFVLMGLCGLAVGWRIERGAGYAIGALALVAGFQFATTWVGMYLGLVLGNEQAAGQPAVLVLPVTMLSNVFVPTSGMPAWLRVIADWNPVSAIAAAMRDLFGNPTAPANGTWPLLHPVLASAGWLVLLPVIFVPLCAARYARA